MAPKTSEEKMIKDNDLSPIQKFYSGANIFITGATGFLGKCILEKLLRTCPDVGNIYILLREKKGKSAADRVQEIFKDIIYSELKEKNIKLIDKVIPISGDVSLPGLGMNLSDRFLLQKEVNIVLHAAATINFNEKLRKAVATNICGTREILQLSKEMSNLKSIVHVSTAYSNCHLDKIDEKFYKYPLTYKELLDVIEKMDDQTLDELTPKFLGKWVNTYVYTKAMAENLIQTEKEYLPIIIFRPAIVTAAYKEPLKAWVDNNWAGVNGICFGAITGLCGSLYCNEDLASNLVPVDMVVNGMLACGWKAGFRKTAVVTQNLEKDIILKNSEKIFQSDYIESANNNHIGTVYQTSDESDPCIFNYVSNVEKPITWGEFADVNTMVARRYPLKRAVWLCNFRFTKNYYVNFIYSIIFNLIPFLFFDAVFFLFAQKKPRFYKVYIQMKKMEIVVGYFTNKEFQYTNDNMQKLWLILDTKDKELFPFSIANMNWPEYLANHMLGTRKYLCKEDESTLPEGIKKRDRMRIAAYILNALFSYFVVSFVIYIFRTMVNFIFF